MALSLQTEDLDKMIAKFPKVLTYKSEENVKSKLQYLRERLSLNDKELSNLVQKFPVILGLSIGENLSLIYLMKAIFLLLTYTS